MLLLTWFDEPFRGTRDLDLLGYGDPAPDAVLDVFREVLGQEQPDGVVFDAGTARISRIREENEYGGLRMRATADIAGARIAVNVDVGFGDATEPPAEWLDYPVLLDMPAPRLRGYARETVVAEKFQAMVDLGMANSRMKDYFDLWIIGQACEIERSRLAAAISATFARRGTAISGWGSGRAVADVRERCRQAPAMGEFQAGSEWRPRAARQCRQCARGLSDAGCGGRPRREWIRDASRRHRRQVKALSVTIRETGSVQESTARLGLPGK